MLGLDPGLQHTGWGVIECGRDGRLSYLGSGVVSTQAAEALAERLCHLHRALVALMGSWSPDEAAVEHTYMNKNAGAALKLGQARGVVLLAAASAGVAVGEYHPSVVKKAVVGTGGAEKRQIQAMVGHLLPGVKLAGPDAADALAVAITHAHHLASARALSRRVSAGA